MSKRLFITATRQNEGKTAITLGLTKILSRKFPDIGFIKPLGREDFRSGDVGIDEDVALISKVCSIHCSLSDMSPVVLPRGVPEEHMNQSSWHKNLQKVREAFEVVQQGRSMVIIEGSGHAGTGSAFGISNARIAELTGAQVLLVSSGGVAQPIDEILLNKALYDKHGATIIGVVLNKVFPGERDMLERLVEPILEKSGIPILGYMPFQEILSQPTVYQVLEMLQGRLLAGDRHNLGVRCTNIALGSMTAHNALPLIKDDTLLVTAGDREDLILPAICASMFGHAKLSGIVLSGGFEPSEYVMKILEQARVPVILCKQLSYEVAAKINHAIVRITPDDSEKIALIEQSVRQNVNIDFILDNLEGE